MQLNTYLKYGGNCEEAFKFYEQHLGGKITSRASARSRRVGRTDPPSLVTEKR